MVLYNDSFQISHAMKQCEGKPQNSIFLESKNNDSLDEIIKNNPMEFTNFLHKIGLDVEHKEKTLNAQNSSITVVTLKTACFKVDFNDNLARITHLK